MSSHNPYQPSWNPYHQNKGGNNEQDNTQGYSSAETQGANAGMQTQGGLNEMIPEYSHLAHGPVRGQRSVQGYPYSSFTNQSYHGTPTDMQYVMQMISKLDNQIDKLSQLISQNNQLLQKMHDQEDTKCVQGSGGSVIVRM